jgi:hypothetical protein
VIRFIDEYNPRLDMRINYNPKKPMIYELQEQTDALTGKHPLPMIHN